MTRKSWDEKNLLTKVNRRSHKDCLDEEMKGLIYSSLDDRIFYHLRFYERLSRHLRYGRKSDLQFLSRSRTSPIFVGLFCFEVGEDEKEVHRKKGNVLARKASIKKKTASCAEKEKVGCHLHLCKK